MSGAVGVLGVQGSFSLHVEALRRLGAPARLVRRAGELAECDRLIIPGGESTVISKFLEETGLGALIAERARSGALALFGTCAGAIVLGREPRLAPGEPPPAGRQPVRLALADVEVRRNAYGRQIDSFRAPLALEGEIAAPGAPFEGVFIRAPRFGRIGAAARVLAREGEAREPVLVREGRILLATFHPELTDDLRIHRYFLECV